MKVLALIVIAMLMGCSAPYRFVKPRQVQFTDSEILSRYLDRYSEWKSFSCSVKMKAIIGDTVFTAKGTMLYLAGERFSLSFARPYNQILGDIYATPEQLIYWGNGKSQAFFRADDTVRISNLIPLDLPDWDPRDLLPFVISARTAGFQVLDTGANGAEQYWITGENGPARHSLLVDSRSGLIKQEVVARYDNEQVRKVYSRTYDVKGWPISSQVVCSDSAGRVQLKWQLYNIDLSPLKPLGSTLTGRNTLEEHHD